MPDGLVRLNQVFDPERSRTAIEHAGQNNSRNGDIEIYQWLGTYMCSRVDRLGHPWVTAIHAKDSILDCQCHERSRNLQVISGDSLYGAAPRAAAISCTERTFPQHG